VLLGGSLGTFLGGKISDRIRQIVIQGVGLVTLVIGVEMALGTNSILLALGSVLIGGILVSGGAWMNVWRNSGNGWRRRPIGFLS